MTMLLTFVIGPSFLFAGWNVGIGYILTAMALYLIVSDERVPLSGAGKYLSIMCAIYYVYFAWRIVDAGLDARAGLFFNENLVLLCVPFLLQVADKFDVDVVLKRSADFLFPASVLLLIFGLIENQVFHVARIDLLGRSPLILAVLIVSGVHFSLTDWKSRSKLWRLGAVISWFIGLYVIGFLTDSRATFLLYFVALGIFVTYLICSVEYSWRKNLVRILALMFVLLLAVGGVLYLFAATDIFPRFKEPVIALVNLDLSQLDTSSIWRIQMWDIALNKIQESPIIGFGPQNTFAAIAEDWPHKDIFLGHLHNDILNHLMGGGAIGLMIYFALLFSPIVALFINRNWDDRTIYLCVLICVLVFLSGLTARVYLRPVLIHWAALTYFFVILVSDNARR